MSSIPLVALMGLSSTHPVQPDNAVEDAALAQRVGAGRQQQAQSAQLFPGQLQQQGVQTQLGQQAVESGALQLAQQKAINDAWKQAFVTDPDGTSHLDPNNLTSALAKSGAGAAIPAVQKGFMDMQENIQKIAKGKSDLDNLERDAAGAGAQGILSSVGPDGTVPQYARAAFFQMMHNGGYDQEAQAIQQHLQQFKNNPQGEADLWKSIVAASPAQQKLANEHLEAQAKATGAATQAAEFGAKLPGGPLNRVTQDIAVATNPQIQQGKVAVAAAEGQARANVEAQMARGSNAALANVPPHLIGPASTAAEKAGADYAQAKSVSDRISEMTQDAKAGNVVSYQLLPQEGALQLTTSQGVHRINMAEIQNYGGGSLWQQMQGHFGKALTGKSIPDSVLKDMSQIQDLMARGSQEKYSNTLATINQTYGSKFQPVKMGELPASKAGIQVKDPRGVVHTFPDQKSADSFKQAAGIQ